MLHPAPARLPLTAAHVTPNWFAAVMGTGIVATSAVGLPVQAPALRAAATVVWLAAAALLVVLVVATARHWHAHRATARSHHLDPVMAHFYGAPPMAFLTVGAGTLLLGPALLGERAALVVGATLWTVGTVLGLASAVVLPVLQLTRHARSDEAPFAGWLMPVVPPMVSAATGALLLPHVPAGQARLTFALALGAMFGVALLATGLVLPLVWGRLVRHGVSAPALVPTLWIVLGPLGQSATAALALGREADLVVGQPTARVLEVAGVLYAVPVLGFALLWATIALVVTRRTARAGLPFALTWWAFTFPVGTCVTGLSGLALHTGSVAAGALAVGSFVALVGAWLVVAARTWHGALVTRVLLSPAPRATPARRPARALVPVA
jgi:tellurite resistance protein TehA-like permease